MEIGEPSLPSRSGSVVRRELPGSIEISVVDRYSGRPIEGARVTVGLKEASTNAAGIAYVESIRPRRHSVYASKAWPKLDHITFLSHYPKLTISHKAVSAKHGFDEVTPAGLTVMKMALEVYRPLVEVVLHRKYIHPKGEDKYGHWWTKIDGISSYGWWPKVKLYEDSASKGPAPEPPPPLPENPSAFDEIEHTFASAAHAVKSAMHAAWDSVPARTWHGVEGDLNGTESYGGKLVRRGHAVDQDPHHKDWGEDIFQPVLHDGRDDDAIKEAMRTFSLAYTGGWSWRFEFGNHCHTFQKRMMEHFGLKAFRQL